MALISQVLHFAGHLAGNGGRPMLGMIGMKYSLDMTSKLLLQASGRDAQFMQGQVL